MVVSQYQKPILKPENPPPTPFDRGYIEGFDEGFALGLKTIQQAQKVYPVFMIGLTSCGAFWLTLLLTGHVR